MTRLNKFTHRLLPMIGVVAVLLVFAQVAEACPNCKNGMSSNETQAKNMAAGYYYSILFMLSMPFLIFSSFSGWMYLAVRRARAEREEQASAEGSDSHANADQPEMVNS